MSYCNESPLMAISFTTDGSYIATADLDAVVRIWKVSNGIEVASFSHDDVVTALDFDPNGRYLAIASEDSTVQIWDVHTRKRVSCLLHHQAVNQVAFCFKGKYLSTVTGSKLFPSVAHTGCTASIWNASTTQKILDIFHPKGVKALVSSSKGKFLALAGCDGNVAVWNINLEEKILPLQLKYQVEKFAVSSNSSTELLFALVHSDNFHLHQINFRPPLIHVQQSAIVDIAFSTDEKYFIVGRLNGIAVVYDTTTGQEITRITHEKEMSAIAFSPNGKYLVTASGCKARIWAACTAKEIGYTNLQGRINVVAFSPDGKFLAIATGDSFSQKKEYGDFQLIGFSNLLNRC